MKQRLSIAMLSLTAALLTSDSHGWPPETGIIHGRLVDARTCTPISYASVLVEGTTVGAMTARDGTYSIYEVPVGKHTLRVRSMVCQPIDSTVTVTARESLWIEFALRDAWSETVPRKPSQEMPRCPEHSKKMKLVLVPTGRSEVHVLYGSRNGQTSPYAWPEVGGSSGKLPLKVGWGPSCPRCVVAWNDKSSHEQWKGLEDRHPGSWEAYVIPGVADFMGPAGLTDSVVVNKCTRVGTWSSQNLRVEILRVPPVRDVFRVGAPAPPRGEYVVFEPLDECKTSIWVIEKKDYCRLAASLASSTNSVDNLDINVIARGKDASKIARTILGTMLFPEQR
jgi:hypothetical protein